jgi:hypothetical protein
MARADRVDCRTLVEFLRPRHRGLLVTRRSDGSPQLSPVTCGIDAEGRVVVSTYPTRACRPGPPAQDAGRYRRGASGEANGRGGWGGTGSAALREARSSSACASASCWPSWSRGSSSRSEDPRARLTKVVESGVEGRLAAAARQLDRGPRLLAEPLPGVPLDVPSSTTHAAHPCHHTGGWRSARSGMPEAAGDLERVFDLLPRLCLRAP